MEQLVPSLVFYLVWATVFVQREHSGLILVLTFSALGLLLLTILAGFTRDIRRRYDPPPERR